MNALVLPLPAPNHIQMNNVAPGANASADGGGLPKVTGQCSAVIQNDPDGVFSVVSLETMALVRDPDAPPHSPPVWESSGVVSGGGPIAIDAGEGLIVMVSFACPARPAKQAYSARAAVVLDGAAQKPVLQIPIGATVLPEA